MSEWTLLVLLLLVLLLLPNVTAYDAATAGLPMSAAGLIAQEKHNKKGLLTNETGSFLAACVHKSMHNRPGMRV
jgi:hypothetical protein